MGVVFLVMQVDLFAPIGVLHTTNVLISAVVANDTGVYAVATIVTV